MKIPRLALEHRSVHQSVGPSSLLGQLDVPMVSERDLHLENVGILHGRKSVDGASGRQVMLPCSIHSPLQRSKSLPLASLATRGIHELQPARVHGQFEDVAESIAQWRYALHVPQVEREQRQALADKLLHQLQGETVCGSVDLKPYPDITCLPDVLRIQGDLLMADHLALRRLPQVLWIQGDLDATGCCLLNQLGCQLFVGGNVLLSQTALVRFAPESFHIGGHLQMRHCSRLELVAGQGKVEGNVDLSFCSSLQSIMWQETSGDCLLLDCFALVALPDPFRVAGMLDVSGCCSLVMFPEDLSVQGRLLASRCTQLHYIFSAPQVGESVFLCHCPHLQLLPQNWHIHEQLDLSGCRALPYLPCGLQVDGTLRLEGCIQLEDLPDDLVVQGHLYLGGCQGLQRIPQVLLQLSQEEQSFPCVVHCSHAVFRPALYEHWQHWSIFHQGRALYRLNSNHQMVHYSQLNFRTLQEAWSYFGLPLPWAFDGSEIRQTLPMPVVWLDQSGINKLLDYCKRMLGTAEYKTFASRYRLHLRLQHLMQAISQPEHDEALLRIMEMGLDSCQDGLIYSLDEIELYLQVQDALKQPDQPAALRRLAMGLLQLEVVRQQAARLVAERRGSESFVSHQVDEIEVYLALQLGLAERLQLPLANRNMLYETYAELSQDVIDGIGDLAAQAAADEHRVANFLQQWAPWQHHLRHRQAANLTWQDLPSTALLPLWQRQRCPITLQEYDQLEQPVVLLAEGTMPVVLEWGAFVTWWCIHGVHPVMVQHRVDLHHVFRLSPTN